MSTIQGVTLCGQQRWKDVASRVNNLIPKGFNKTNVKERADMLLTLFTTENNQSKRKSRTNEQYLLMSQLLQQRLAMVYGEHLDIRGDSAIIEQDGLHDVIEAVRRLIKDDGRIKIHDDSDEFLQRFLKACDCDPEKSYQLIISYFQAKEDFPEEFSITFPSNYVDVISRLDLGFVLRRGDCDGRTVLFLRFGNVDPGHDSWSMCMQSATVILESISLEPEAQDSGVSLILDCTNFSLKIMKWSTPHKLKAIMKLFQECVPVRFDYLHIVNAPLAFKVFYTAISPFIRDDILQKIIWHKKPFTSLLAALGPDNTPKHLGGNLDISDMEGWYQDVVLTKEPLFKRFFPDVGHT